jgi:hypothetical protein
MLQNLDNHIDLLMKTAGAVFRSVFLRRHRRIGSFNELQGFFRPLHSWYKGGVEER